MNNSPPRPKLGGFFRHIEQSRIGETDLRLPPLVPLLVTIMANTFKPGDTVFTVQAMLLVDAIIPATGEETCTRFNRRAKLKIIDRNDNGDYTVETEGGLHCLMSPDEIEE